MKTSMSSLLPPQIEERLTQHAKNVLERTLDIAETQHNSITLDALLYTISQEHGSLGATALLACDIHPSLKEHTKSNARSRAQTKHHFKNVLKISVQTAMEYKQKFIGTEHILYGLTAEAVQCPQISTTKKTRLRNHLKEYFDLNALSHISIDLLKAPGGMIAKLLTSSAKDEAFLQGVQHPIKIHRVKIPRKKVQPSVLSRFCEDLTAKARKGKTDPLIGRSQELDRMMRILIRRTKNNPLLIGEPGVGKTALVQGLARKIVQNDVPHHLQNKKLYSLNINALVAGTAFRGEFEERMRRLTEEAAHQNTVLFIDEIHTIIGAGSAQGSLDVANIIKPALVDGNLQCIGATTFEEFKKSIEKDTALDRRFQKIPVYEESKEQSIQTLTSIASMYEKHHNVRVTPDIIKLCVDLAVQYLPMRSLPDKAIDVLDEASSKANTHHARTTKQNTLTNTTVYEVVAEMASVPIENIKKHTTKALAKSLRASVIGQDQAIHKLVYAVQRNRAGIRDSSRPIGSFLFSGASGTGKSHLAKIFAQHYTNANSAFIKIDMSEFSEAHTVSRLIGSPAGYIGYEDAGLLTKKVRQHPGSVILFDEIEKAHPSVLNILLQILEDGVLTDSQGRIADFKNAVIILTTNIGADNISRSIGFQKNQNQEHYLREELSRFLRKELINRIDEIILFRNLTQQDMERIVSNELALLKQRVQDFVVISYTHAVPKLLAQHASTNQKGARAVRSLIQHHIENAISSHIIENETSALKIAVKNNEVVLYADS